jgi:hypothetical protein
MVTAMWSVSNRTGMSKWDRRLTALKMRTSVTKLSDQRNAYSKELEVISHWRI